MDISTLIIIFAVIVVVVGSVIALVWWHLADVLFPGAAEKTGQRIFGFSRKPGKAPPEAKVVSFDEKKRE